MRITIVVGLVVAVLGLAVKEAEGHGYKHRIGTPKKLYDCWGCKFPSQTVIDTRWERKDVYKVLPVPHDGVGRGKALYYHYHTREWTTTEVIARLDGDPRYEPQCTSKESDCPDDVWERGDAVAECATFDFSAAGIKCHNDALLISNDSEDKNGTTYYYDGEWVNPEPNCTRTKILDP